MKVGEFFRRGLEGLKKPSIRVSLAVGGLALIAGGGVHNKLAANQNSPLVIQELGEDGFDSPIFVTAVPSASLLSSPLYPVIYDETVNVHVQFQGKCDPMITGEVVTDSNDVVDIHNYTIYARDFGSTAEETPKHDLRFESLAELEEQLGAPVTCTAINNAMLTPIN